MCSFFQLMFSRKPMATAGKQKTRRRFQRVSENGLISDHVQKTRRDTMKCHATRFSAAAAVIGMTGFANISARCCGNFRSGSIYLLHALAKSPNHLLPLSEMVASDRCKE
jgi:hypothetical protein